MVIRLVLVVRLVTEIRVVRLLVVELDDSKTGVGL